jgi:ATP-dependent helicase HrpA
VVIDELTHLHGLEVRRRRVAFGNLDPRAATALFIRSALVEEDLLPGPGGRGDSERDDEEAAGAHRRGPPGPAPLPEHRFPAQYRFLEHNRRIVERIENWQTRVRHRSLDPDQALFEFYSSRLENVSSVAELNRWLRDPANADRLCAHEADLTAGRDLSYDADAFPETWAVSGQPVPLRYAYAPGEEHDGVTVRLPFALIDSVSPATLDWAIPGLRAGLVEEWLRALPKSIRRQLQPIPPKVEELVRNLTPTGPTLAHDLARYVRQHFGVEVSPGDVEAAALPAHLRPRLEVLGPDQRVLAAGRDVTALRSALPVQRPAEPTESPVWKAAAARWERFGLTGWTLGDVPEKIELGEGCPGVAFAWPGLDEEEGQVHLKLFLSMDSARRATRRGWIRLLELVLLRELAWLQKDLRAVNRWAPQLGGLCSVEALQESAFAQARRQVLVSEPPPRLTRAAFDAAVAACRARIPGLAPRLIDQIGAVLQARLAVVQRIGGDTGPQPAATARTGKDFGQLDRLLARTAPTPARPSAATGWHRELNSLVPPQFLETLPPARLPDLPRYLKALLLRIERAGQNPSKDQMRQQQVDPYLTGLASLRQDSGGSPERQAVIEEFRWAIEEFKVSLFAQELGTAFPVSAKRLSAQLDQLRGQGA